MNTDVNLKNIAENLPSGISGADLHSFCTDAYMSAVSRRIHEVEQNMLSKETFFLTLNRVPLCSYFYAISIRSIFK